MDRNTLKLFKVVAAGDMASTITSEAIEIQFFDNIGIQINFTGASPDGTFEAQVSIDEINWTSLSLPTVPEAVGIAGTIYLDLNQLSAPFLRVAFIPDVGSIGLLDCFVTAKGV